VENKQALTGEFMKKRVLFLCTANSCRSQMAEGIVNHLFADKITAFSAGTEASTVHPTAIEVMKEIGIDISSHRSKDLSEFDGLNFDCVITFCGSANEVCPLYIGGAQKTRIGFDDPAKTRGTKEEILQEFRRVRDEIKKKLTDFFRSEKIIH
jgi:arsenate reductase (thioredoxin)